MRSTNERMELLKKRTYELKKKRNIRKNRLIITSGYVLSLALITAISIFTSYSIKSNKFSHMNILNTGSIFTNGYSLGYVVVGILAFLLGISVTILCSKINQKNKKEKNDDGIDG